MTKSKRSKRKQPEVWMEVMDGVAYPVRVDKGVTLRLLDMDGPEMMVQWWDTEMKFTQIDKMSNSEWRKYQ